MTKKITISVGVALVMIAAAVWLIRREQPNQAPVEIHVLGESSSNLAAISELIPEFTTQTGIKVSVEAVDFETARVRADTDLAQRSGRYDIVLQYNFALSPYVRNGYVDTLRSLSPRKPLDLSWEFESELFDNVWREVGFYFMPPFDTTAKFEAVAYPFAANTMLLVVNRELYEDEQLRTEYQTRFGKKLAPPATWDEFRIQAEFFTRPDRNLSGVALQGADGGWLYYEFMNFLFGQGGRTMTKPYGWASDVTTAIELDTPEAAQAAAYYLGLKPYNAGGFLNVSATEQRQLMKEGRAAIAIMWSDYIYDLARTQDGAWSRQFIFAPVPGERSMIAGGSFYINRKSIHKQEALRFINFLLQQEPQARMFLMGLNSPLQTVYEAENVQQVPYASALLKSLARGAYMLEAGPDADLISEEITKALQEAWRNGGDAREAMRSAAEAITHKRAVLTGR